MSSYVIKHLKLLRRYAYLSFKRALEYRISLYFNILHALFNIAIWLVFWQVLLAQIPEFQGWDLPTLSLLIGFFFLQEGLWIIFWKHWELSTDVLNGYITVYLVRPINSFYVLIWKDMDIMRVAEMTIGVCLIAGTIVYYGIETSMGRIAIASLMCILGAFMSMSVLAFANTCVFWIGRVNFLRDIVGHFLILDRMPLTILPGPLKFIYTFIFPLVFIATYPSLVVAQLSIMQSLGILALEIVIASAMYTLLGLFWMRGLRRFEAYGG